MDNGKESLEETVSQQQQRIDELEQTVRKMMPSRRDALKAGAVGAVGMLGFGAGNASAELNDGDTQWGSDSNRDDYIVDHVDANVVDTDELSGGYSTQIRVFTNDGATSIDPSTTATPIQDAADAINSETGIGVVSLPGGEIASSGNVSGLGGVSLIGQGFAGGVGTGTLVSIPDDVPFVDVQSDNDGRGTYLDQFIITSASTPRTSPVFEFNHSPQKFNIGQLKVGGVEGDDVFYFNTGGPYSSRWGWVEVSGYNRAINWGDADLPGLSIGHLRLGSSDSSTPEIEKTVNNSTGFINIESWNKGGIACPMFTGQGGTYLSGIRFGPGNFEPSTDATIDHIFRFTYRLRVQLEHFSKHGYYTLDTEPLVFVNNDYGDTYIFANHALRIEGDNKAPFIYGSDSSDVNNATGGTLTHGVSCLGDLTSVN